MVVKTNETLENIMNRRSIRDFKEEQIVEADLEKILDAALHAPNAMNQQKWHFTVIQNKDILDKMVTNIKETIMISDNDFLKEKASRPEYNTFYNAPTVILITADEEAPWIHIDCGLAAQNITLAAESLGIGSCIIASTGFLFNSGKSDEFKKELGIPEGYSHVCSVALGYKAGETPDTPPRDKNVINYVN